MPPSTERAPLAGRLAQVVGAQTAIARAGLDAGSVLRLVAAQAKELCSAGGAAVIARAGGALEARAAAGTAAALMSGAEGPVAELARQVLESGQSRLWPDAGEAPCRSAAGVPVRARGLVAAALVVLSDRAGDFTTDDVQVLQLLAGLAGAAVGPAAAPPQVRAADAERLAHLSTHDPLTFLPNRSLFADRLRHALSLSRRHRSLLCVMAVDLAGLGAVNEKLGAAAGDEVLRTVADRLRATVREPDTVARIGGDEFAVLLSGDVSVEVALAVRSRILRALGRPATAAGRSLTIHARVGIAFYPHDGDDAETLVSRALAAPGQGG